MAVETGFYQEDVSSSADRIYAFKHATPGEKLNSFSMFDALVCKARSHLSHIEQPEISRNIFSVRQASAAEDSTANLAVKRVPAVPPKAVWEFSVKDGFKAFDKDST